MMSLADRKYPITIFIPVLLASVLLLHSPASSDEGVKDAKEVKEAQPALSSETAGKIDEEIASVTADPSEAAARVRLGYLLQLSFLCGAYTAITHTLERESL